MTLWLERRGARRGGEERECAATVESEPERREQQREESDRRLRCSDTRSTAEKRRMRGDGERVIVARLRSPLFVNSARSLPPAHLRSRSCLFPPSPRVPLCVQWRFRASVSILSSSARLGIPCNCDGVFSFIFLVLDCLGNALGCAGRARIDGARVRLRCGFFRCSPFPSQRFSSLCCRARSLLQPQPSALITPQLTPSPLLLSP